MSASANTDQRFAALKQKYASVLNLLEQQGVRLQNLHVQDNKLFVKGTAPSEAVKNNVWNQIKLVDSSYSDLTADIMVDPSSQQAPTGPATGGQSYTVQPGDTLSKIAKQFYGDATAYMDIFNANKDKLQDPDKIRSGQELTIPPRASR